MSIPPNSSEIGRQMFSGSLSPVHDMFLDSFLLNQGPQSPHSPLHRRTIHPPTVAMISTPTIPSPGHEGTRPSKPNTGRSPTTVAPLTMSCVPAVLDVSMLESLAAITNVSHSLHSCQSPQWRRTYMRGERAPRRPSISQGACLLRVKRVDPSGKRFGKLTLHATITGYCFFSPSY